MLKQTFILWVLKVDKLCATDNTLFQSKMSVNVSEVEIKILKWTKNQHCICFTLQEMKYVTKYNRG